MAQHIGNLATCTLPRVDKAGFYRNLQFGDMIFCSGQKAVSKGIQSVTGSPWSHVFFAWLAVNNAQWLTIEATFEKGVHVGLVADYADLQDGPIAIVRNPKLTVADNELALATMLGLLDYGYDCAEEVSMAARKLWDKLPLMQPKRELFCSGLQYEGKLPTHWPLQKPGQNYPTPEDNFTDPNMEAICLYMK